MPAILRANSRVRKDGVHAAATVLAAAALVAAWYARSQRTAAIDSQHNADRQSRRSQALALAAQSKELSGQNDSRALLLAVEAAKATAADDVVTPAARDALGRALQDFAGVGLAGHRDVVDAIAFSSDETKMITAARGEVRVWTLADLRHPACAHILNQPAGASATVLLDAKGDRAITLVAGAGAKVWPLVGGQRYPTPRQLWDSPADSVLGASTSGQIVAVASKAGTVGIFSLADLRPTRTLRAPADDEIRALSFSNDGKVLLAGTGRSHVWVWDLTRSSDVPVADIDADLEARQPNMEREAVDILGISDDRSIVYAASSMWFDNSTWANPDLKVWRMADFQPQGEPTVLSHRGAAGNTAIQAATLSGDGHYLFTSTLDAVVRSWRIDEPSAAASVEPERRLDTGAFAEPADFSRSSGLLAIPVGNQVRLVSSAELATQRTTPVTTLRGFDAHVQVVRFSPGGHLLAAGGLGGLLRLWTLDGNDPVTYVPSATASPYAPALQTKLAENGELVGVFREASLEFWDIRDLFSPRLLRVHPFNGADAAKNDVCGWCRVLMSPDNRWAAVQGRDANTADIVELSSAGRTFQVPARVWTNTHEIDFAGDGRWLLVKEDGGRETIYDLRVDARALPKRIAVDLPPGSYSRDLSPDGQRVVYERFVNEYHDVTGRDQVVGFIVSLEHADDLSRAIAVRGFERGIGSVSFSRDGRIVAMGGKYEYPDRAGDDTTVTVWRTDDPLAEPLTLSGQEFAPDVAVSSDGRWLMTASKDVTLRDARTRTRLWRLDPWDGETSPYVLPGVMTFLHDAELSPDGRFLVTISDAGPTARLWRLGRREVELAATLTIPRPELNWHWKVIFSSDSSWLVISGTDNPTPYLWKVSGLRGASAGVAIANGNRAVQHIEFTLDGKYLVIENSGSTPTGIYGGAGAHVTMVDMAQFPAESATFFAMQSSATNAAIVFREDMGLLVEAGSSVRAEAIGTDRQLARARAVLGRNLTLDEWVQTGRPEVYRPTFSEYPVDAQTLKTFFPTVIQRQGGKAASRLLDHLVGWVTELDEADVCNSVAWQLVQAGRGRAALEAITCALKHFPGDSNYRDTRGVALALMGRTAEAIEDWGFFVDEREDDPSSSDDVDKRRSWIFSARAGLNPFADGFVAP